MLKNAYLDAKIGFDPAENEPRKECCYGRPEAALPAAAALLTPRELLLDCFPSAASCPPSPRESERDARADEDLATASGAAAFFLKVLVFLPQN